MMCAMLVCRRSGARYDVARELGLLTYSAANAPPGGSRNSWQKAALESGRISSRGPLLDADPVGQSSVEDSVDVEVFTDSGWAWKLDSWLDNKSVS